MNWRTFTCILVGSASIAAGAEPRRPAAESKTGQSTTIATQPVSSQPSTDGPSETTTARLTESLPKFTPSKIEPTTPDRPGSARQAEPQTASAVENPVNSIIRLPQFDVREDKLPKFNDRELRAPEGRAEVALKRHPGLRFGPLAFLNVRRGLQMLDEEDELARRREMADLISFGQAIERELPQDPATGARTVRTQVADAE
jgi:hypothetical protein